MVKNSPVSAGDTVYKVRSLGRKDPLEEEMATRSSILAFSIPWTEDPGRLQSMVLPRVRHDLADLAHIILQLISAFS